MNKGLQVLIGIVCVVFLVIVAAAIYGWTIAVNDLKQQQDQQQQIQGSPRCQQIQNEVRLGMSEDGPSGMVPSQAYQIFCSTPPPQ